MRNRLIPLLLALLGLIIFLARRRAQKRRASAAGGFPPPGQERPPNPGPRARPSASGARAADDPYTVLGVSRSATQDEIRDAFRARMSEYHPDKVEHLGKELRELAHQKTVAIQRAYARLKRSGA